MINRRLIAVGGLILAAWPLCGAADAASKAVQPACGVPGYVLETSYRFGRHARLAPGEIPVRSIADMVKLGWKHDQPWGRINHELQTYVKFDSPEAPNVFKFERDDLAIVARHDATNDYGSVEGKPDCAYTHIFSGELVTDLTVQPPAIVEFEVMIPEGRGMWPAVWLYDCHSGKGDGSEIDVMESEFNAPIGQRDDRSRVYQYDHGPGLGRTLSDPGGLDTHGGWWQPYGSLRNGDPGSDMARRWAAYSVWWQPDRVEKFVDDKPGIVRAFKWTGGGWPNLIVNSACGSSAIDWCGPISPETFAGDNSTMRIKWMRVFKPVKSPADGG